MPAVQVHLAAWGIKARERNAAMAWGSSCPHEPGSRGTLHMGTLLPQASGRWLGIQRGETRSLQELMAQRKGCGQRCGQQEDDQQHKHLCQALIERYIQLAQNENSPQRSQWKGASAVNSVLYLAIPTLVKSIVG